MTGARGLPVDQRVFRRVSALQQMSHDVLVMRAGEAVEYGPAAELSLHLSTYTRARCWPWWRPRARARQAANRSPGEVWAVHLDPDREVEDALYPCPLHGQQRRGVQLGQLLQCRSVDQSEQHVIAGTKEILGLGLDFGAVLRIRRGRIRALDPLYHRLGQHIADRPTQQALFSAVVGF